jgi:hypothetical protein
MGRLAGTASRTGIDSPVSSDSFVGLQVPASTRQATQRERANYTRIGWIDRQRPSARGTLGFTLWEFGNGTDAGRVSRRSC